MLPSTLGKIMAPSGGIAVRFIRRLFCPPIIWKAQHGQNLHRRTIREKLFIYLADVYQIVLCQTLSLPWVRDSMIAVLPGNVHRGKFMYWKFAAGCYHIGLRYFNKTNGGLIVRDCATEIHGFFKCSGLPLSHSLIVLPHRANMLRYPLRQKSKRGIVVNAPLTFLTDLNSGSGGVYHLPTTGRSPSWPKGPISRSTVGPSHLPFPLRSKYHSLAFGR